MAYVTHHGDFSLCRDRAAPVASGIGGVLRRLARALTDVLAQPRQREFDREIARVLGALRRTHHGQHRARNDGERSGV